MAEAKDNKLLEEVFQNVRKAAEANLKLQQEVVRQWTSVWPALPSPQSALLDKTRDFQRQWSHTVSDLARKHRDVIDRQYQAAVESLDAALKVAESSNPEEFRRRSEQLCRKSIDCLREVSEAQVDEFQTSVSKWTELMTQAGS